VLKHTHVFWTIILGCSCISSAAQQHTFNLERLEETSTITYTTEEGRLTGNYVSIYNNGIKRCEGKLVNGYRNGRWIVWDSTGRKRMERIYKNPFEFERIFPAIPNEGPIPMLVKNQYRIEYDSDGVVKYAKLKAEDAQWRHKYWRYLGPVGNELLFKDNWLLNLFFEKAKSRSMELFNTADDRFTTLLNADSLFKIIDNKKIELIAFEIKEENIFDMDRLISEYRIIGICPIVKINGQIQQLFWVYYPDLRKQFGKEKLQINDQAIKTLDDLFIFRHFSSTIIKTTVDNPYDKFIKDFPNLTDSQIQLEQEQQELILIEYENSLWIWLTK